MLPTKDLTSKPIYFPREKGNGKGYEPRHLYIICDEETIATTDVSLSLSAIPQSFINTFTIAYIEGNIITDVDVKYREFAPFYSYNDRELKKPDKITELKTDTNNYISIKRSKEHWNRNEVIELLRNYAKDTNDNWWDFNITNYINKNL